MHTCAYTCALCMCEGQRLMMCVLFKSFETRSLHKPGTHRFNQLDQSVRSWGPPVSASPVLGLQAQSTTPDFLCKHRRSKFRSSAASILPSLPPLACSLNIEIWGLILREAKTV